MARDTKRQSKHKDASVAICSCHMCKPHKHNLEPSMRPSDARKVPNGDLRDQLEDYNWDKGYTTPLWWREDQEQELLDKSCPELYEIDETYMEYAVKALEGKIYPVIKPMNQSAIDRIKAHKRIRKG